jgi:hypothetical protein
MQADLSLMQALGCGRSSVVEAGSMDQRGVEK